MERGREGKKEDPEQEKRKKSRNNERIQVKQKNPPKEQATGRVSKKEETG